MILIPQTPQKPIVRVTQLESFRRYMEQSPLMPIEEQTVIDAVKGKFKGNNLTRIGQAFHSLVETGRPTAAKRVEAETVTTTGREYYTDDAGNERYRMATTAFERPAGYELPGGVRFDSKQIAEALAYRDSHPFALHEWRRWKDYGPAIVTGKLDMADGLEIRDIKTKFSEPQDEPYLHSCQAPFYMELFKLQTFHFDLFVFDGYKESRDGMDVRGLALRRYGPITRYWDDQMAADNRRLLRDFMEWADTRHLLPYLKWESVAA